MNTRRWLLPFTWSVNMQAIDAVVSLAEGGGATLVAVSLVSAPDGPGTRGVRLEHIQQSKDFLEALYYKAARMGVSLERHEVFTTDVMQSIMTLTHELGCDGIVLVSQGEREALLHAHQLKRLLEEPPAGLLVLRLATQPEGFPGRHLGARMLAWLRRPRGAQDGVRPAWNTPELEGPLWIRTKEYR